MNKNLRKAVIAGNWKMNKTRAEAKALALAVFIVLCGEENNGDVLVSLVGLELFDHVESAHFRHFDIQQNQLGHVVFQVFKKRERRLDGGDLIVSLEQALALVEHGQVVVDQYDFCAGRIHWAHLLRHAAQHTQLQKGWLFCSYAILRRHAIRYINNRIPR